MALVGLTPYVTDCIINKVEDVFTAQHAKVPMYPNIAPMGVGDEAYSIVLPPENEKAFSELLPDWAFHTQTGMYIEVVPSNPSLANYYGHSYILAPFKDPHVYINGSGVIRNVPGIEMAEFQEGNLRITPAKDGSTIKLPALRDYVANIQKLNETYGSMRDEIDKAKKDMATFLSQHRTLQKAVKAFGPSLLEYVPPHIMQTYNRAPIKREKKIKPEVIPVDTEYLTAAAVAHKLGLN